MGWGHPQNPLAFGLADPPCKFCEKILDQPHGWRDLPLLLP